MSKKPYKILFDANPLLGSRTGIGHYTARLITAMAGQHTDAQFVGYYYNFLGRKQTPVLDGLNISFKPIYHAPGPLVNALRRARLTPPVELLVGSGFDFVLYTNFLGYPSLRTTPRASIVYDLTYVDVPQYGAAKNVRDLQKYMPKTIQDSNFLVTISSFSKQRIMQTYGVHESKIIKTFIPPDPISHIKNEAVKGTLSKFKIGKPFILSVGTLEPRKNIMGLLDAYTQLSKSQRETYSLVLAGKYDWKFESIKQKIEAMQTDGYDIICTGYTTDAERNALYQAARLYVMSSFYEGFGMPLIEAMGHGVACIASDLPVLKEIGGTHTQYFDPNDISSISSTLSTALKAPTVDSQQLKDYVESLPSWTAVASDVFEKINDCVASD